MAWAYIFKGPVSKYNVPLIVSVFKIGVEISKYTLYHLLITTLSPTIGNYPFGQLELSDQKS